MVEFRLCGSWKVMVNVVLLLTLRRTMVGASGGPEQGHTDVWVCTSEGVTVCKGEEDLPNPLGARVTHVHAGSLSSCVCTACSSTPTSSAACLCGRLRARGRPSEPESPDQLLVAPPPAPEHSGAPPDSPRSQLTKTKFHCFIDSSRWRQRWSLSGEPSNSVSRSLKVLEFFLSCQRI